MGGDLRQGGSRRDVVRARQGAEWSVFRRSRGRRCKPLQRIRKSAIGSAARTAAASSRQAMRPRGAMRSVRRRRRRRRPFSPEMVAVTAGSGAGERSPAVDWPRRTSAPLTKPFRTEVLPGIWCSTFCRPTAMATGRSQSVENGGQDDAYARTASANGTTAQGDAHRYRGAIDQDDLVSPIELVGPAGRDAQGHIGCSSSLVPATTPWRSAS